MLSESGKFSDGGNRFSSAWGESKFSGERKTDDKVEDETSGRYLPVNDSQENLRSDLGGRVLVRQNITSFNRAREKSKSESKPVISSPSSSTSPSPEWSDSERFWVLDTVTKYVCSNPKIAANFLLLP